MNTAAPCYSKQHGARALADWQRVNCFAATLSELDGVRTAMPLGVDAASGTIEYEWLPDLRPILSLEPAALTPVLAEVGTTLARLHAASLRAAEAAADAPHPLAAFGLSPADIDVLTRQLPEGFFWGDCWHGNVLLAGGLVFLDPLPNPWLFDRGFMRANGALDVAMLYMSLYFCHPLHRLIGLDVARMREPARAMLAAYLDTLQARPATSAVLRLSRQLAVLYIAAYRRRLPLPIALARQAVSRRILGKLDRITSWNEP